MIYQPPLPPEYSQRSDEELTERIRTARSQLGSRCVLLGHHYQRDEVIQFADFTGDSLKLAQLAAEQTKAEFIVFCGVHFMAESADILTTDKQKVILPDLAAGCSMADMADIDDLEDAWEVLSASAGQPITPITYVNSTAAIKAFVGQHNGACCTSSNAQRVIEWGLHGATPDCDPQTGNKLLFLPDQHLGRNTAYAMGWPLERMVVYDPHIFRGGLLDEQVRAARFILWQGHCSVHQLFNHGQIEALRAAPEPWQIIVHPECPWDVCQAADDVGSTEHIIRTVTAAPSGTYWAVGTENHLVQRLAKTQPDKHIRSLAGIHCMCETMFRIDLSHLCWALENLAAGNIVNQISVDQETKHWSRVALNRMLELRPTQPAVPS